MRRSRQSRNGGVESVVKKLEARVADGDYYSALQMHLTLVSRHRAQGKTERAQELLVVGIHTMLRHDQLNAATQLGLVLLDNFTRDSVPLDDTSKALLFEVCDGYSVNSPELAEFLRAALAWSATETSETGLCAEGDPDLQLRLARALAAAGDGAEASKQFALAHRPDEYAAHLIAWMELGYPSERDLFLARALAHLLALRFVADAEQLLAAVTASAQSNAADWLNTPILRFFTLLMQLAADPLSREGASRDVFMVLRKAYAPSLARDPVIAKYVDKFAASDLGVVAPSAGGLMAMVQNMMGGGGGGGGSGGRLK
jgi:hypothetical protein